MPTAGARRKQLKRGYKVFLGVRKEVSGLIGFQMACTSFGKVFCSTLNIWKSVRLYIMVWLYKEFVDKKCRDLQGFSSSS